MKRAFIIALVALALSAATFVVCYRIGTRPLRQLVAQPHSELAWLAREFQLSADQAQRIERLEADYEPRCMETCRKIAENNAKLDKLITASHERTPEMETLLRESAEIQVECRREMLSHIYSVAGVMSPEQSRRYLALMKLQVLQPGTPHTFTAHGEHE